MYAQIAVLLCAKMEQLDVSIHIRARQGNLLSREEGTDIGTALTLSVLTG